MDYLKRSTTPINIKVIGVGGGGNNAVSKMVKDKIKNVDFYLVNTDAQFLERLQSPNKIVIGKELTKGLGAGSVPKIGEEAAKESYEELLNICNGADIVFITAGMGGGTGTGGAPIIAQAAKEAGALVISSVTMPFQFEGKRREMVANEGLMNLEEQTDALIIIENDKILAEMSNIPINKAFAKADALLEQTVRTIVDLVTVPGVINLDFADVKYILKDKGRIHIGIGIAEGENRSKKAAYDSINSGIINPTIEGAQNAIVNITGGSKLSLSEVNEIVNFIKEESKTDLNVIFGFATTDSLGDKIIVTTIATGFENKNQANIHNEPKKQEIDTISQKEIEFDEKDIDDKLKGMFEELSDTIPEIKINFNDLDNDESELDSIKDEQVTQEAEIDDNELPSFLRKG